MKQEIRVGRIINPELNFDPPPLPSSIPQTQKNPNPRATQGPDEEEERIAKKRPDSKNIEIPPDSRYKIILPSNQESKSNKYKKKPDANFVSIWSQEDEIKVLEGVIKHKEKRRDSEGSSLDPNLARRHRFILSFEATDRQFQDKIYHLKTGYANVPDDKNIRAKGHEEILHKLCDKIWPPAIEEEEEDGGYDSIDYRVEDYC